MQPVSSPTRFFYIAFGRYDGAECFLNGLGGRRQNGLHIPQMFGQDL